MSGRHYLFGLMIVVSYLSVARTAAAMDGVWKNRSVMLLEQSWDGRSFDCNLELTVRTTAEKFQYTKILSCKGDAAKSSTIELNRRGDRLFYNGEDVGFISNTEIRFSFYDRSTPNFPRGFIVQMSPYRDGHSLDDMFVFGRSGNYKRLRGTVYR